MKIEFRHEPLAELASSALVSYAFEGTPASSRAVELLPAQTRNQIEELQSSGELCGKLFECTLLHKPLGLACSKLLVIGAGKREKFSDAQIRRLK